MTFRTGWLHGPLANVLLEPKPRRYAGLFSAAACAILWCSLVSISAFGASASPPANRETAGPRLGRYTGLPLPRFAALRSGTVNLRRGPGRRYPIDWVLSRRFLPIEILREFQDWRFVRIPDGTRGWVHRALLIARRSFLVGATTAALRSAPKAGSRVVALLKPGVVGRVVSCRKRSPWCKVRAAGYDGYLNRTTFWGLLPGEAVGG